MMTGRSVIRRASGASQARRGGWLPRLLAERSVQVTALAWLAVNAILLTFGADTPPFDRPGVAGESFVDAVVAANVALIEVFFLMAVVYALTRTRARPDLAARAPARDTARRETLLLVAYAILGQVGGVILGRALGWHSFSLHVVGTLYGTHEVVEPTEVVGWAIYNCALYAVVPYLVFRRHYSAASLNLRSSDLRNDLIVVVAVLAIESLFQLFAFSSAILQLAPRELLLGAPLTFVIYLIGTDLPIMIFVYGILVTRYLKLTESVPSTVILGGITYTLMHLFDGWTAFTSPGSAALSVAFLFLVYFGPGMIKTFLTVRTGNAWVHLWAYHAIAPHTLLDTPFIARVFGIR
jgi:hypothetical protein